MTRSGRTRAAALVAALVVVALGGCSSAASPSPSTSPTTAMVPSVAPVVATVPAALRGTYGASIVGTTASSGNWTLEITSSDVLLTNPIGGDPFSVEPSALTETKLTVRPSADCPDQATVTDGQYTVSLSGAKLTLTALHDSCGDRKAILSTTPWIRK